VGDAPMIALPAAAPAIADKAAVRVLAPPAMPTASIARRSPVQRRGQCGAHKLERCARMGLTSCQPPEKEDRNGSKQNSETM
jgi:hypothetical protein